MNKRIIIILLLLCVPSVLAKEEVVRKYKYYYLEREDGPYSLSETEEYPNIDREDFIYTDFVSAEKPEEKEKREIEKVYYHKYKRTKNINHIKIENFSSKISDIDIDLKHNGNDIDYSITWPNEEKSLETNQYLIIDFNEEIDQNLLKLKMTSDTSGNNITITTGDDNLDQTVYRENISSYFEWEGTNATYYTEASWVEDVYPTKLTSSLIAVYKGKTVRYKYRDKLYRTYRENKIYSEDYLLNPEEPFVIRDENDYIEEVIKSEEPKDEEVPEKQISEEIKEEKLEFTENSKEEKIVPEIEIIEVPNTGINTITKLLVKQPPLDLHFTTN